MSSMLYLSKAATPWALPHVVSKIFPRLWEIFALKRACDALGGEAGGAMAGVVALFRLAYKVESPAGVLLILFVAERLYGPRFV